MADRHLEAAAEAVGGALIDEGFVSSDYAIENVEVWNEQVEAVVQPALTAYLDSLLGELPEEAVEATARSMCGPGDGFQTLNLRRDECRHVIPAFLRSLRDSVEMKGR